MLTNSCSFPVIPLTTRRMIEVLVSGHQRQKISAMHKLLKSFHGPAYEQLAANL